jgi:hypothetical protein
VPPDTTVPPGETLIDVRSFGMTCNQTSFDENEDWGLLVACDYAVQLVNGGEEDPNFPDPFLPQWIEKAMHPKSIANSAIAITILDFLKALPREH